MATKNTDTGRRGDFRIVGRVELESAERPDELKLAAYAYSRGGTSIGKADVDAKGAFTLKVGLSEPTDVQLAIGPDDDPQIIRKSAAYTRKFAAEEWTEAGATYEIKPELRIPAEIWRPWYPKWFCVSGHVRKLTGDGTCPVPFVKVEIFDVDREPCWWPYILRWKDLLRLRKVIRVPELLEVPPKPWPDPGPLAAGSGLFSDLLRPGAAVGFNPQPDPPRGMEHMEADVAGLSRSSHASETVATTTAMSNSAAESRVGEMTSVSAEVAADLEKLTLTSKIAPWLLFRRCFYSRRLVCETHTDNCGYFRCCFRWWPFHLRNGRLRFDSKPDIVIRVTQVIDGVEKVIYLDPYTSTRWNVTNAHIDLYLDDSDIQCGSCEEQDRPEGTAVFFTRVGNDEVYWINQTTGLYGKAPYSNVAYGHVLRVHAQFGDALSTGSPARYYRLSYRMGSGEFQPIAASLDDTRVSKVTLFSESHNLGPNTVNGTGALYEIRNFDDYYWYNPDWIGIWNTLGIEDDTGKYTLRLEVFDQNGVKLTAADVDYRDGTVAPPAVLPPMGDQCDLVVIIDNKSPVVDFDVPGTLTSCGVIKWTPALTLSFNISVAQENNRLRSWGFQYTKGVDPTVHLLTSGSSLNGLPGSLSTAVSGAPLLVGLTGTCAFALKLWAYAHVRNGYSFIYYREMIKAIAIEKCS